MLLGTNLDGCLRELNDWQMGSCCPSSWASRAILLSSEASTTRCLIHSSIGRRTTLQSPASSQRRTRPFRPGFLTVVRHISDITPAVLGEHGSQAQLQHARLLSTTGKAQVEGGSRSQDKSSTIQADIERLPGLDSNDVEFWGSAFSTMLEAHGLDGVWAVFELARKGKKIHLLLNAEAEDTLEHIAAAACQEDARLELLMSVNNKLRVLGYPRWPNFYIHVMRGLIQQSQIERTTKWHRYLCKKVGPTSEDITHVFSMFITDERKWVQKALLSLYSASPGIQIYDRVIPVLFERGQLNLARAWRKVCVGSHDFPVSAKSYKFLSFMTRYFPQIMLETKELALFRKHHGSPQADSDALSAQEPAPSDGPVAKWFASSWLPIDIVINTLYQLGTKVIGPRALQALALREPDASSVTGKIAQLEGLGIRIASQPYCDAIRHFSKRGQDQLLSDLLNCDIHPTEFNDPLKRQTLLDDAIRRQDHGLENVLKGIEAITETRPSSHRLDRLLEVALRQQSTLGKAFMVLDRMNALHVNVSEENGRHLLKRTFRGRTRPVQGTALRYRNMMAKNSHDLDLALGAVRQLALNNFPISLWHWTQLLYNLGDLGRMNDLERMSFEFIRLFSRQDTPLVPVFDQIPGEPTWEKQYVPVELPFSHRQHPVQELFSVAMQRFIVRCGFHQALPKPQSSVALDDHRAEAADYGVASGVFLLAALRDQGVLIDQALVENTVVRSIQIGQKSEGMQTLPASLIKSLVDQAWGSELVPSVEQIGKRIRRQPLRLLGPTKDEPEMPPHRTRPSQDFEPTDGHSDAQTEVKAPARSHTWG